MVTIKSNPSSPRHAVFGEHPLDTIPPFLKVEPVASGDIRVGDKITGIVPGKVSTIVAVAIPTDSGSPTQQGTPAKNKRTSGLPNGSTVRKRGSQPAADPTAETGKAPDLGAGHNTGDEPMKTTTAAKKATRPARKAAPSSKRRVAPKAAKTSGKKAQANARKPAGDGKVTKLQLVADLLRRPSGCTNAEILAVTLWPSVSVPQQAKAAGLKLRKEKAKGEPTRYFGTPID